MANFSTIKFEFFMLKNYEIIFKMLRSISKMSNIVLLVYFETGTSTTATTLAFTIATTGGGSWRIKISQIECKNTARAPYDCLQYYTGRGGNILSFNQIGGILLRGIQYTICIRQELGYCGIEYRAQDGKMHLFQNCKIILKILNIISFIRIIPRYF